MNLPDWKKTSVSPDQSHHLCSGKPLYDKRFDEVLKYHAPGLAPARDASGSYHIDLMGQPVYAERYQRTFGFYDGRASVVSNGRWFHLGEHGEQIYSAHYAWTGNYQEGRCTVRSESGLYSHIDRLGQPVYDAQYHYAGDFRDGVAVVQNEAGHSTHIDRDGALIHARWFADLDVFHKGFARAQDERGWHHINRSGDALYTRRFAEVEPFYNGQARAKRFDGGLEVIDERGERMLELRPGRTTPLQTLSDDMVGFWKTQTIQAGVELGVFDALPANTAEVAQRTELAERRAMRLLYGLWELELVRPDDAERWCLTECGALLGHESPSAMAYASSVWARDHYQKWQRLPDALRAEATSEKSYFKGLSGAQVATYQRAISGYARHDYAHLPETINWREHKHVIDAGGGQGVLLAQLLTAHAYLQGTLLELPQVLGTFESPGEFSGRLRALQANLFEPWPSKADAIVLARVLHDWPDSDALRILKRARQSLHPNGKLYVIEMIRPDDKPDGSLLDLNMLVMTGGRERTHSEWTKLLTDAGFHLLETRNLPSVSDILIGAIK